MARTFPMGSSSRLAAVAEEDRLSSLPDELLHAIMSFLPVRQAVQTCVLSRRWELLWCNMPCLNIDQQEFDSTESGEESEDRKIEQFEDFVNSLLMFHRASLLDKFRFHVTHVYGLKVVERWICRGMKCCPAVVEICRSSGAFFGLPHVGSNACRLKKLHLVWISLDKSFTQLLSSGCPLLEDLNLDRCLIDSPEITSCTLKNLIVKDCSTHHGRVLTITAPDLVSFYLVITVVGSSWGGILVNEMPLVAKSTISLRHNSMCKITPWRIPCKLLSSITNVKKLELSGSKMSMLHEGSDPFPTFSNLRTLIFDGCDLSDDFQTLGHFLNDAPNLEKLSLLYCKLPGSRKRKRMEHPKRISVKCQETLTFQCPNLKFTEIKHKEDDVHQLFGLLSGIWRNLLKTTIVLTKA